MTASWSMPPGRRRRSRRPTLVLGLAGIFTASALAGWAIADPGAFDAAVAGIARGALPTASPGAPAVAPPAAPDGGPGQPTPAAEATTPAPAASPVPASPTPAASPPAVPKALAARLDRALARARERLLLPGVEATVLFPDGSTWTGALGSADVATGRPVDADTPFAIASVTKTFTTALVLRYAEQGRLRLDDRLASYLPDWPNARRITIRMLLGHTSGIPDFFANPKIDKVLQKDPGRAWTPTEILAYVPKGAVFPPGKGWAYSNTNFVLLGLVAEKVGGAPWADLVRRELIEPLGLTATYVQGTRTPVVAPAQAYRMIAGAAGPTPQARGDGTDIVPFRSVVTAAGSAGSIASTTADLARWARALYGGSAVLDLASRRAMLTCVKTYAYGTGTSYGLGVSRVSFDGHVAYGHTGALAGTRAAIRYFPKEKVAIAVAFNRETFVGDDVVRILARALFPAPPAATPSTSPGTSAPPTSAP